MGPCRIQARALEDASWDSVGSSISKGSVFRALQQSVGSERRYGLSVKLLDLRGEPLIDFCFRVEEAELRERLLGLVRNPMQWSLSSATSSAGYARLGRPTPAALPTPSAPPLELIQAVGSQRPTGPWTCSSCTYRHLEIEAELAFCAICEAPRPEEPPAPPADRPGDSSRGPPLSDERPARPPSEPEAEADVAMSNGHGGGVPADSSATGSSTAAPVQPVVAVSADVADADPAGDQSTGGHVSAPGKSKAGASPSVAQTEEDDDSGLCTVCLEVPADAAVVPCGHMCACYDCLQMLSTSRTPLCPMCRGPVTAVIRIYRS